MKTTLIKTLAIALMVFAFNASPVMANEKPIKMCQDTNKGTWAPRVPCADLYGSNELKNSDQVDNERDIADSGNEGSTSAASANDQ